MNTQPAPLDFRTAQSSLTQAERDFVLSFCGTIADQARRAECDLVTVLDRLATSGAVFDWRTTEFLSLERVRFAIRERCEMVDASQRVSHERMRRELALIGFASIEDFLRVNPITGLMEIELNNVPARVWSAVSEIQVEESANGASRKVKIKMHDKLGALKMLGEHNGFGDVTNAYRAREKMRDVVTDAGSVPAFSADTDLGTLQDAYSRLLERS